MTLKESKDTEEKHKDLAIRLVELIAAEAPSHTDALAAMFLAFSAMAEQYPCCMHTSGVLCLQLGGRLVASAPPDHPIR